MFAGSTFNTHKITATNKYLIIQLKVFDNVLNKLQAPIIDKTITLANNIKFKMIAQIIHVGITSGHYFGNF